MCTNAILSDCIRELNALPFNTNSTKSNSRDDIELYYYLYINFID